MRIQKINLSSYPVLSSKQKETGSSFKEMLESYQTISNLSEQEKTALHIANQDRVTLRKSDEMMKSISGLQKKYGILNGLDEQKSQAFVQDLISKGLIENFDMGFGDLWEGSIYNPFRIIIPEEFGYVGDGLEQQEYDPDINFTEALRKNINSYEKVYDRFEQLYGIEPFTKFREAIEHQKKLLNVLETYF